MTSNVVLAEKASARAPPGLSGRDGVSLAEPKAYNEIAGRSVERLAALSDGLFAIAMTLLIIERTPRPPRRSAARRSFGARSAGSRHS